MSEFDGKNAKINITAVDNTASGVSSARASINSLKDRTVNVTVKYNVQECRNWQTEHNMQKAVWRL